MKIYRNTKEILRKDTLGRRFSLTGLGILFVGMLASFVPTMYPPDQPAPTGMIAPFLYRYWALISFAALPLGFLTASIGSYFINRFARRRWPGNRFAARPDQLVERSLKGTDDKHAYFAYSLPVAYVIAGPFGLINLAVRSDKGKVTVDGDRWREPLSFARVFTLFAREGVGNPVRDVADQEKQLRDFLARAQSASGVAEAKLDETPIASAVLFLNEGLQLVVNNPSIPVLRADQLKDFLRRRNKESKLPPSTHQALLKALEENATYQAEEEE